MTPKTNKDKVIAPQYRWGFPDVKHMQSLVTYPFTCINYPFWMYLVTSLESKSINHQTILSLYKIITKESFYQKNTDNKSPSSSPAFLKGLHFSNLTATSQVQAGKKTSSIEDKKTPVMETAPLIIFPHGPNLLKK